ncbi:MAG: efflux RND transporter periplasmic adaptor subunit [Bacteroidaceae bacterium]|nr:efflux RND transporter periplasmic adaptor subunit [Bacteroidaceae bacterium]
MKINNQFLSKAFVISLVAIVIISLIGILAMSHTRVVLQGQIEATEIRISGKLPGRVDTFLVAEGQSVKRGDTLVGISSPEAYAKLQQANAMEDVAKYQNEKIDEGTRLQIIRTAEELWNKSKTDLQLAETTYRRIQALYKDSVVSAQRYDEAEALYKVAISAERASHQQYILAKAGAQKQDKESARSLVDAAQGTVNEVQSVLQDAWLTAPMNGEIATIYAQCGELVGTGTPIMNLVVLEDCHVVLNVREDYLSNFATGEIFKGKVPALKDKKIEFKVNYISPLGSFATWKSTGKGNSYDMRTFEIHALPIEKVDGLRPGMSVLVEMNE